MSPEDNGRMGRIENKVDMILDKLSGSLAIQAAHGVRIDSIEKDTDSQTDRLDNHGKRIGKTETSLSRIWGGMVIVAATGLGSLGAMWAWVKDTLGGGGA